MTVMALYKPLDINPNIHPRRLDAFLLVAVTIITIIPFPSKYYHPSQYGQWHEGQVWAQGIGQSNEGQGTSEAQVVLSSM